MWNCYRCERVVSLSIRCSRCDELMCIDCGNGICFGCRYFGKPTTLAATVIVPMQTAMLTIQPPV